MRIALLLFSIMLNIHVVQAQEAPVPQITEQPLEHIPVEQTPAEVPSSPPSKQPAIVTEQPPAPPTEITTVPAEISPPAASSFAPVETPAPSGNVCCDNPGALLQAIEKDGGAEVVHAFSYDDIDKILAHIETGDLDWLQVAGKIAPYADAAFAEGISISLATALPVAPEPVLQMVGNGPPLALNTVCGLPFIEPDEAFIKTYKDKAKTALASVTAPDLQQKKSACNKQMTNVQFSPLIN